MTLRLRDCEPAPHDLVHVDQLENALVAQCTAHSSVLHACVSAECGHAVPPLLGSVCARLRVCEPPPHDLVHVDHAPKLSVTQSTAHACLLQSAASS